VFEIDATGALTYAVGAISSLTGLTSDEILSKSWAHLVTPADRAFLGALLDDLEPGERRGPFAIGLARDAKQTRRSATISLFRLPNNGGRTSCAVSLTGTQPLTDVLRDSRGLVPKDAFEKAIADVLGQAEREGVSARLEMIEVRGLAAAMDAMAPDLAEDTLAMLAGMLRAESYTGMGAAEVAVDRFALVATRPIPAQRISDRLKAASGHTLETRSVGVPVAAGGPDAKLRTIRYVLDRYIESGAAASADFAAAVEGAARASARFRVAVGASAFNMAYQPIVSLDGDRLHHFEALARFDDERGPMETIRMAEEFGLIRDFDLAVVGQVARMLARESTGMKIAANISGASLVTEGFVEALTGVVARSGVEASRLLLEVTETARIHDIEGASGRITALRKLGHAVCMDDFGAGSASLEYVSAFEFDFIKFDGAYVRALTAGSREATLIRHMTALCKDLGVVTIAEMVETPAVARELKTLGVALGQGWAYGKPEPVPRWTPPPAPAKSEARRRGLVETWG
jgi:EAL domain-containing protein (putative c-di-GMP-specific phosphodiesterase class I)